MRGDPDRPRGETARVAARVQALLREYHLDAGVPAPPASPASPPGADPLPWLDAVLLPTDPLIRPGAGPRPAEPPLLAEPQQPVLHDPLPTVPPPDVGASASASASARAGPLPRSFDGGAVPSSALPEWQLRPAGRRGSPSPDSAFTFAPAEETDLATAPPPEQAVGPSEPGVWQRVIGRVPVRLDPGRRTAVAIGVAVLLAALVTGLWLLSNRPRAVPVAATSHPPAVTGSAVSSAMGPAGPSGSRGTSAAPAEVVVDVAGKVRRPGLYRLPAGSRVDDAIRAAGGARPGVDLSGLNLAAKLVDGQQVAVGTAGAPGGPGGSAGVTGGSSAAPGPVDLNTASLEQLETLPGVGPVLAQHILDYRTQHGGFASIDQLREVSGIGDVRFTQLRDLVTA